MRSHLWLLVFLTACGTEADQDNGTDKSNSAIETYRLEGGNYVGPVKTVYDNCGTSNAGTTEMMSMFVFGGMPADYTCSEIDGRIECTDLEYFSGFCSFNIYTTLEVQPISTTELTGTLEWDFQVDAARSNAYCTSCLVRMTLQMAKD